MKLASTYVYFEPPGGGAHEIIARPVPHTSAYFGPPGGDAHEIDKYLRIFWAAGRGRTRNWQVLTYIFDRRAVAHMKLASTCVYF